MTRASRRKWMAGGIAVAGATAVAAAYALARPRMRRWGASDAALVMTRKMLLNVARRAEALALRRRATTQSLDQ